MNLKQLEAFITVAEQGSFSKAAQRLFTSPTALTQQLNALERYLQCTVLERTYRGVRLTPAGEVFYQYAKSIMKQADEAGKLDEAGKRTLAQLKRYEEFCHDIGVTQEEAGLAWLIRSPYVTCPIIGANEASQIESSAKALEVKLTEAHLKQLDEIFPPMGEAPETYAW